MIAKKKVAKRRSARKSGAAGKGKTKITWEWHAAQIARLVSIPEAEVKQAIRSLIESKRARQAEDEQEETEFERQVHREKVVFPEDLR